MRREWIVFVAVGLRDSAVLVVDDEFGVLVAANLSTPRDRFGFGLCVSGGTTCAARFYIPSALMGWSYVN